MPLVVADHCERLRISSRRSDDLSGAEEHLELSSVQRRRSLIFYCYRFVCTRVGSGIRAGIAESEIRVVRIGCRIKLCGVFLRGIYGAGVVYAAVPDSRRHSFVRKFNVYRIKRLFFDYRHISLLSSVRSGNYTDAVDDCARASV